MFFRCKHNLYKIIDCEKDSIQYLCKCEKCGEVFTLSKGRGEYYEVGTVINVKNLVKE